MMREDDRDRVCRQGTEAWRRLKREKSWSDWLAVGEALQIGRDWAMEQAGTNTPEGKGYNMAFGEWLQRYKFDDMDKGDRSRLFAIMDDRSRVEAWRATLTLTERLKLNHPNAVLRKFKAAHEPEKEKEKKQSKLDKVVEEKDEAERTIADLEERLAAAENGGLDLNGDPRDICSHVISRVGKIKAREIGQTMIEMAE